MFCVLYWIYLYIWTAVSWFVLWTKCLKSKCEFCNFYMCFWNEFLNVKSDQHSHYWKIKSVFFCVSLSWSSLLSLSLVSLCNAQSSFLCFVNCAAPCAVRKIRSWWLISCCHLHHYICSFGRGCYGSGWEPDEGPTGAQWGRSRGDCFIGLSIRRTQQ